MTSISVGIPSASTTAGAASNAFQRVVKEASPDTEPAGTIQWNNQETGGDPPSLRQYSRGNLQAVSATNFAATSAKNDLAPFQKKPIDSIPYQGLSYSVLDLHLLAVDGSNIQTTDDLIGAKFWPFPPAWGLRQLTKTTFKNAGLWSKLQKSNSIINTGTDSIAGAIEEGRVNALVAYGANGVNLAGWATEVDARADLHLVKMTDSFKQGVQDTRGTNHGETDVYGWESQNLDSNMMDTFEVGYQFWFGKEIPRNVGYELARISHQNVTSIQEGQPAYADHSSPAKMKYQYIEDHPIHPGPYDFLDDQGVDMNSYTRGKV